MKSVLKSLTLITVFAVLTACGSGKTSGWKRLAANEVDQKSYAIAYSATAQTYLDRVNESYDIDSFMHGVDDWYTKKVALPIEQIRASLLNRMLDHDVYAYYSGVLYAAELQQNAIRLSPKCWDIVQPPSLSQGIHDAMLDLQKNTVRDDAYIKKGAEDVLHLCVEQVEADQKAEKAKKKK
ncbi:hypothetical protein [Frederiksenia canicola]|uniref:Domain amino terminal to FKBP-type peptidyl-prolyl isomerase n=1 Tax=Frederiksenia canicola TaxID=123824 RepID=A0AAE7C1Z7_9PAST|nr:hypothetical protein [Frederiksenia canicola]QIM64890.1 hypothetical protein A4G17_05290 [Frederiksenia canicola]RPE92184.1 hypothetical protein EDC49_1469 [Frederiksenia canicola]